MRTAEAACSQTAFPEMKPVRIVSFWRVRDQRYLAKSPWERKRGTSGGRREHVWTKEFSDLKQKSKFSVYTKSTEHDAKYPTSRQTVVLGENFGVGTTTQLKSVSSLKRAGNYYQIRMRSLQFLLLLTADGLSSCEHQSSPCYIWRSLHFPAISGFVLAFTVCF